MITPSKVVIALTDLETRRVLTRILSGLAVDPVGVSTVTQFRELLDKGDVGLVFCGRHFVDGDFEAILTASRAAKERPPVVLVSSRAPGGPTEEIPAGAFGAISVACRPTDVEWAVIRAERLRGNLGIAGGPSGSSAEPFMLNSW